MHGRSLRFEVIDELSALELPDELKLGDRFEATAILIVTRVEDQLIPLRTDAGEWFGNRQGPGSVTVTIRLDKVQARDASATP